MTELLRQLVVKTVQLEEPADLDGVRDEINGVSDEELGEVLDALVDDREIIYDARRGGYMISPDATEASGSHTE